MRAVVNKQRSKVRNWFSSIFFQFPHRFVFNYMFYFIHNVLGGKTFRKGINIFGNEIAKRLLQRSTKKSDKAGMEIEERIMPYEERLKKLDLYPLEQRRLRGDLIETYKILTGKENLDCEKLIEVAKSSNLRGNSRKLYKKRSKMLARQNFFSQRIVNFWKVLPTTVVEAPSVNSFKSRLDRHWKNTTW